MYVTKKLTVCLKEPLDSCGEWLPVKVEGISYWLLHVTKKTGMENIDLKASERIIDVIDNIEVQKLSFIQNKIHSLISVSLIDTKPCATQTTISIYIFSQILLMIFLRIIKFTCMYNFCRDFRKLVSR